MAQVGSGWVSHLWFGFEFGKKTISSGRVKKYPGSKVGRPLIYCKSKVSSGRVGSGPISKFHQLFVLNVYYSVCTQVLSFPKGYGFI